MRLTPVSTALVALLLADAPSAQASNPSQDVAVLAGEICPAVSPEPEVPVCDSPDVAAPESEPPAPAEDPLYRRMLRYTRLAISHRVSGLASYYSSFFDGRKTANGEIFRNRKFSAAHLTLPLGTWIEVRARATGKKLRLRVNDRGPYAKKFCLDLSQAAARELGVDVARDRHVDFRIIALPGEKPLPEDADFSLVEAHLAREAGDDAAGSR